jgi:endo-1,4-beta-xylanase
MTELQKAGKSMNTIFKPFLILTVLITVISAQNRSPSYVPPAEPMAKPYADGTFENGMDSWFFWTFAPKLGSFEIVDYKPHSGNYCGRFRIDNVATEIWHVQLQQKNFQIKKNNLYKLEFWARGENGAGILEVVFIKGSPPWTYYSGKKFKLTDEWKPYEMLFTAPSTTTDIQMNFQCAHSKGDYFIDDVVITDAGYLDLKEVPADWYDKAEQRIDSLRKGSFSIKITDAKNTPFNGSVEVHLKRHEFPLGTCLNFAGGDDEQKYRATALRFFNSGVFENALKWEEYEPQKGAPKTKVIDEYLKWGEKNKFPIRGHTLVWGIENYGYQNHWARQGSDQQLRDAIKERITRDLTLYKGKILEYDVWNEPVHETAHFHRLGYDILDSSFVWAHRADPGAKLYINEYSIISGGDAKIYRDMIEGLLKRGVPVHGIGVQGHFQDRANPLDIAAKLDYLAEIGLPIKVTEFDMNVRAMNISEADQAKEYAKVLRTCFSHPAIEGFLFWGFWDARHWCPGAGLYDFDFKARPAADTVYNLIHNVWSTHDTLKVGSDAKVNFRGFYGEYDIVIRDQKGKKIKQEQLFFGKKGEHVHTVSIKK